MSRSAGSVRQWRGRDDDDDNDNDKKNNVAFERGFRLGKWAGLREDGDIVMRSLENSLKKLEIKKGE